MHGTYQNEANILSPSDPSMCSELKKEKRRSVVYCFSETPTEMLSKLLRSPNTLPGGLSNLLPTFPRQRNPVGERSERVGPRPMGQTREVVLCSHQFGRQRCFKVSLGSIPQSL